MRNGLPADDGRVTELAKLLNGRTRNQYPVSEYGAVGNGTVDDHAALLAAITAAAASGGAVVCNGRHRIAVTISVTVPIIMMPGARLVPDAGVTVTLGEGVTAARNQYIFDQTGGGVVYPHKCRWHPGWWGPTGTTNDTVTWQEMARANAAQPTLPIVVEAPSGTNRFVGVTLTTAHIHAGGYSTVFSPPVGHIGSGDYMVRLMMRSTIQGGLWNAESVTNIRMVEIAATRVVVRDAFFVVTGNTETYGVYQVDMGSVTPKIIDCLFWAANGTGTAIFMGSSDAEVTNVWIGRTARGIVDIKGSGTYINCHIWECTQYGMSLKGGSRVIGCYIETNLGWGLILRGSIGTVVTATRFWANGHGVADTGGVLIAGYTESGNPTHSYGNILDECIFDDNTGTGVSIIRSTNTRITGNIHSTRALTSQTPSTTNGVVVDAESATTQVDVVCLASSVLGSPIVSAATDTCATLGRSAHRKATTLNLAEGSTGFNTYMTRGVNRSGTFVFSGRAIVQSADPTGIRIRLQCSNVASGRWETAHNSNAYTLPASAGNFSTLADGSNAMKVIYFSGTFTTGANNGDLIIGFARAALTGGAVSVLECSLDIERIG